MSFHAYDFRFRKVQLKKQNFWIPICLVDWVRKTHLQLKLEFKNLNF